MTDTRDAEKLRVLLPHWIEHNAEHAAEFRVWAQKVDAVGAYLVSAADHLEDASSILEDALQQMSGNPEPGEGKSYPS
jgi:hypothetical protein